MTNSRGASTKSTVGVLDRLRSDPWAMLLQPTMNDESNSKEAKANQQGVLSEQAKLKTLLDSACRYCAGVRGLIQQLMQPIHSCIAQLQAVEQLQESSPSSTLIVAQYAATAAIEKAMVVERDMKLSLQKIENAGERSETSMSLRLKQADEILQAPQFMMQASIVTLARQTVKDFESVFTAEQTALQSMHADLSRHSTVSQHILSIFSALSAPLPAISPPFALSDDLDIHATTEITTAEIEEEAQLLVDLISPTPTHVDKKDGEHAAKRAPYCC